MLLKSEDNIFMLPSNNAFIRILQSFKLTHILIFQNTVL